MLLPRDVEAVERYRRRRDERIKARFDADDKDIDWITVHGNKVPLIDGVAIGGHYKGQKFLRATTTKTSGTRTRAKTTRSKTGTGKTEPKPVISATHQKFKDRIAELANKRKQAEQDSKTLKEHLSELKSELFTYESIFDRKDREDIEWMKERSERQLSRSESMLREARKYKKILDSKPSKDSKQYQDLQNYYRKLGVKSKTKDEQRRAIEGQIQGCNRAIRERKNEISIIDEYLEKGTETKRQELIAKVKNSMDVTNRKIEKSESDALKFKEQRRNAVNSRLKSVNDCKDSDDVRERILNSGLFNVEEKVKEPVFGIFDIPDSHSETSIGECKFPLSKEMLGHAEKFFERYPKLKGLFKPLDCYRGDIENGGRIARAYAYCTPDGKVAFNLNWFEDEQKIAESDKKMKKNHHRAVYGVQAVIFHEYGHAIDGLLSRGLRKSGGLKDNEKFSDKIIEKCMAKFKKDEMQISKELCRYSVGDREEFLAEAFAEYTCSEKPRRIAAYVGKLVEDEMKRQKYL